MSGRPPELGDTIRAQSLGDGGPQLREAETGTDRLRSEVFGSSEPPRTFTASDSYTLAAQRHNAAAEAANREIRGLSLLTEDLGRRNLSVQLQADITAALAAEQTRIGGPKYRELLPTALTPDMGARLNLWYGLRQARGQVEGLRESDQLVAVGREALKQADGIGGPKAMSKLLQEVAATQGYTSRQVGDAFATLGLESPTKFQPLAFAFKPMAWEHLDPIYRANTTIDNFSYLNERPTDTYKPSTSMQTRIARIGSITDAQAHERTMQVVRFVGDIGYGSLVPERVHKAALANGLLNTRSSSGLERQDPELVARIIQAGVYGDGYSSTKDHAAQMASSAEEALKLAKLEEHRTAGSQRLDWTAIVGKDRIITADSFVRPFESYSIDELRQNRLFNQLLMPLGNPDGNKAAPTEAHLRGLINYPDAHFALGHPLNRILSELNAPLEMDFKPKLTDAVKRLLMTKLRM